MPTMAEANVLAVRRARSSGRPEDTAKAFEVVILEAESAFSSATPGLEMVAQRCVRQGSTAAQANLLSAAQSSDPAVRAGLASLARVQMEQVIEVVTSMENDGVFCDDRFLAALSDLVYTAAHATS